uniref:Uncharacterized protein n=1 Tax=Anguilla anguilla TaxID=7936 RepID=A0A0E9WKM2_ANGAN
MLPYTRICTPAAFRLTWNTKSILYITSLLALLRSRIAGSCFGPFCSVFFRQYRQICLIKGDADFEVRSAWLSNVSPYESCVGSISLSTGG